MKNTALFILFLSLVSTHTFAEGMPDTKGDLLKGTLLAGEAIGLKFYSDYVAVDLLQPGATKLSDDAIEQIVKKVDEAQKKAHFKGNVVKIHTGDAVMKDGKLKIVSIRPIKVNIADKGLEGLRKELYDIQKRNNLHLSSSFKNIKSRVGGRLAIIPAVLSGITLFNSGNDHLAYARSKIEAKDTNEKNSILPAASIGGEHPDVTAEILR